MKYVAYKLNFQTGVHFGKGLLNETIETFFADTLYSALCIEALKSNCLEKFHNMAKDGKIVFSDSFPFIKDTLYIPKPMVKMEYDENVSERKKWKKLKYVPIDKIGIYLKGKLDVEDETRKLSNLGRMKVHQKVSITDTEKTEPYAIGVYHFNEGNGVYFILGYADENHRIFVEDLIDSLGYQGIGGKVSSGLGKFSMIPKELSKDTQQKFENKASKYMLLTSALPNEHELNDIMKDASFLLAKRSGFIQSSCYSEELVKKQDMYFLKSGSVVKTRFQGDIYNVGKNGNHPVWKYSKPILMEVSV